MKTIKQVFHEFLNEQQSQLKPKTLTGYEDAIQLFEQCLNGYAYQYLDEQDSKLFDKLYDEENKEFCDIFGTDKIGSTEISEFLDYFMIRKVMGSKALLKTVGRVMKKFVKWMNEKGYMDEAEYEYTSEVVSELKDELPKVEELAELIYEYIEYTEPEEYSKTLDGYFKVTKIAPGKLWFEDYMGGEKEIGPVFVSHEISSLCKIGWVINLVLGKTGRGWKMLESGNVYPK